MIRFGAKPAPAPPSPRSAKQRLTFVLLAGVLALIGAMAAGYYFAMRPVTLRIAVGPANSDDLRVVQNLTQAFNNQKSSLVRLRPVSTDGALASARVLGDGKVDLAIIRGDLEVPKNAQAVATLRKNVAVLWVPAAGTGLRPMIAPVAPVQPRNVYVGGSYGGSSVADAGMAASPSTAASTAIRRCLNAHLLLLWTPGHPRPAAGRR